MQEVAASVEPRVGHVANRVHPGDPVQEVVVAGFQDLASAERFLAASLDSQKIRPVVRQTLKPGESVRFADAARPGEAAYLVFYYFDAQGRPTFLSLTRAHADVPLAIGSCGYQFLLGLDQRLVPAPRYPWR